MEASESKLNNLIICINPIIAGMANLYSALEKHESEAAIDLKVGAITLEANVTSFSNV
jgi:hypothetical protein